MVSRSSGARRIAESNSSDHTITTRHGTRRPRGPVAPAAILFKSLVALLNVASPRLDGALASVVETITGAPALLDSIATCRRAGGPLGPWGPAIIRRVAGPTPWAAFSVRNCGVGAGHDGAGHLLADGNGVLTAALGTTIDGPLLIVPVLNSIVVAEGGRLSSMASSLFSSVTCGCCPECGHNGAQAPQLQNHAG